MNSMCPFCGSVKKPKNISPYPIKLLKCLDCGKISVGKKFINNTRNNNSHQ